MSLLQKLFQKYLRKFFLTEGRAPGTPREWMDVQDDAVRELNKTKGAPKKDIPPFQGWKPKIVKKGGIEELLEGPVTSTGPKGTRTWDLSKKKKTGEVIDFPKKKASGGRIGMAGGGALFKFIEKLFIKASNDIRLGKGKWKGLDQKQIAVQHDNLTKKVVEFQKSGKTVGLEEYFGVDPHTAFIAARDKVKRQGIIKDFPKDDLRMDIKKGVADVMKDTSEAGLAKSIEIDNLKLEFPGITDEMIENILTDMNPQRIAEVKQTMREALTMGEKGMGTDEIINTFKESFARKKQAEGGRASLMYGGDPGFAFEYGGSWADWHDQHRDQMPVEQYIKTKLPKDRLPFREMQSGGLAYMLGEPTYMKMKKGGSPKESWRDKITRWAGGTSALAGELGLEGVHQIQSLLGLGGLYAAGGSVGHAPWLKPTGQQPQPQQPQPGGAPGGGRPDPMKAPRGLPSLAPRTMDPQFMQQQMMQKAMMGQGQPRRGMQEGGTTPKIPEQFLEDLKRRDFEFLDKYRRWKEDYERRKDLAPTQEAAGGGRMGMAEGEEVYGPPPPKKEKKKEKEKRTPDPDPDKLRDPFWRWDIRLPAEEKPGTRVDPSEGIGFGSFGDIDVDMSDPRFKLGKYDPEEDYFPFETEIGKDSWGITLRKRFNQGGRMALGLGSMSRRAFLKMMAAGAALPFIGKGISKVAPKAIPKVTETIVKGADGMPAYLTDLIEVVKVKGTKDFIEGVKKSDYSTVHSYKNVDVVEDAAGNTKIKKGTETPLYGSDEPAYHETHIEITKGGYVKNKQGKMVKEGDEYFEGTVRPDMDGKMKDVIEEIDEVDHLELQKIADEIDTLEIPGYDRFSKASGGLAYMLGE